MVSLPAHADALPARFGPYEVVRTIAQGGMGIVFRARHVETDEPIAVKTVIGVQGAMLASLRREIRALRRMEHPGVVRIFDEGVEDGLPWYAMELLRGHTLRGHHMWSLPTTGRASAETAEMADIEEPAPHAEPDANTVPLSETRLRVDAPVPDSEPLNPAISFDEGDLQRTLTLLRDVCDALAYVHGEGLIHRDLKPENIFVRRDGSPVLVDFGLAAAYQGTTSREVLDIASRILGSPGYMAPEQIRGDLVDARADLYAVGCILFESVTGRLPFEGKMQQILHGHLHQVPPRATDVAPAVPEALSDLIARLLEKRPQDRVPYAHDVIAELERIGPLVARERAEGQRSYLYRPRLCGRETVIERIRHVVSESKTEGGRLILLGGESGVGKTRVSMEIAKEASRNGVRVVAGECAPIAIRAPGDASLRGAPFHPLRPFLLAVADRCSDRGQSEAQRLLGDSAAVLASVEPSLRRFATANTAEALPSDPTAARSRLLEAMSGLMARYAGRTRLLFVLDDLQWADDSTLALLRHLDRDYFERAPVVILGTYRTEEQNQGLTALRTDAANLDIQIGRLDTESVASMVRDMLALPMPPRAFVERLVEGSEGNPFFIAEFLRSAVDSGYLRRDARGRWTPEKQHAAELSGIALPDSLRSLVEARLYALRPATLRLVRLASVLGRNVDGSVLSRAWAAVGGGSHPTEVWDEMLERQILEPGEGGSFRFAHDKLRETAYATIDAAQRKALHLSVAEALEAEYAEGTARAPHLVSLAHHYERAERWRNAMTYFERAGQQALDSGASQDAVSSYEAALRLAAESPSLTDPFDVAMWRRRLGRAQFNVGQLDAALDSSMKALHEVLPRGVRKSLVASSRPPVIALSTAYELLSQVTSQVVGSRRVEQGKRRQQVFREGSDAAQTLGQLLYFRNQAMASAAVSLMAANLAERVGPSAELGRAYAGLAAAAALIPSRRLALRYLERSEAVGEAVGDALVTSWALLMRSMVLTGFGELKEAGLAVERSLALAKALRDVRRTEECLAFESNIQLMRGQIQEAMRTNDQLDLSARKSRNHQALLWATSGRGECALTMGNAREAIAHFEACLPLIEDTDLAQKISWGQVAEAHWLVGDRARAMAVTKLTLERVSSQQPTAHHCFFAYRAMGEVLFAHQEESPTAQGAADLAAVIQRTSKFARVFPVARPMALELEGRAKLRAGRRRAGIRALRKALLLAEQLDMPVERARILLSLGAALPRTSPERSCLLREAVRVCTQAGAMHLAQRADEQDR